MALRRVFSSSAKPPTAVVMLNMGGPATVSEVGPFLTRLFSDGEIIQLGPFQSWLGPLLAKRRTPQIEEQYRQINGSPIRRWTDLQGQGMTKLLDKLSPETAPHKHYIAFRYADPLTEDTLKQMKADGVQRAVAFSQYPQFSCTTAGSSLNHLWREAKRLGLASTFQWSLIDRWPVHETYIEAVVRQVQQGLEYFASSSPAPVLVFTAHSLPLKIVERGDQYPQEVSATVQFVMKKLNFSHPYILSWQSQVGPLPWVAPKTKEVLHNLGQQGYKNVLLVPIGFTSDHVETLYELDIDYAEIAHKAGVSNLRRAPSLNDSPLLIQAQAELVANHLKQGEICSLQYRFNCPACTNPNCRSILNPIQSFQNKRAEVSGK